MAIEPAPSPLRRVRHLLWGFVAVAMLAFAGLYLGRPSGDLPSVPQSTIGGPFTLTGSDGQPFSSARLSGRPAAIFFGFSHCPDVCPTTLARLARLRSALGKGDDGFSIVFITVDPERDTPEAVGRYTALFGTPVIGLTGSPAQIAQVRKQFGVFAEKAGTGDDYSVDHTATLFLIDRRGQFAATITHDEGDEPALAKLKRLAS